MNWACNDIFLFGHWGPGEGSKGQYHLISITKSISKIFLYQNVCLFSQMKDTKHIRQDFHSVAWVMPQGRVWLLLTFCLLLLPLWESVIVLCFVVCYFMSVLVLQSS